MTRKRSEESKAEYRAEALPEIRDAMSIAELVETIDLNETVRALIVAQGRVQELMDIAQTLKGLELHALVRERVEQVVRIAELVKTVDLEALTREFMRLRDEIVPGAEPIIAESEGFWRNYLGQYLSEDEVRERLGLPGTDQVSDLVERHELLAVPTASGPRFPAFQFLGKNHISPIVAQVIRIFSEVVITPYTTASWLRSIRLDGHPLEEWLRQGGDPERVIAEAKHAASLFSR